jgi:hypothetical protein
MTNYFQRKTEKNNLENHKKGDSTDEKHGEAKSNTEKSLYFYLKQFTVPTLVTLEGTELKSQMQDKPGKPGDNTLKDLATR